MSNTTATPASRSIHSEHPLKPRWPIEYGEKYRPDEECSEGVSHPTARASCPPVSAFVQRSPRLCDQHRRDLSASFLLAPAAVKISLKTKQIAHIREKSCMSRLRHRAPMRRPALTPECVDAGKLCLLRSVESSCAPRAPDRIRSCVPSGAKISRLTQPSASIKTSSALPSRINPGSEYQSGSRLSQQRASRRSANPTRCWKRLQVPHIPAILNCARASGAKLLDGPDLLSPVPAQRPADKR